MEEKTSCRESKSLGGNPSNRIAVGSLVELLPLSLALLGFVRTRKCPDLPKTVHKAPAMDCWGMVRFVSMSSLPMMADFHVIPDELAVIIWLRVWIEVVFRCYWFCIIGEG